MDLCAVHAKNLFHTNSFCHRPISSHLGRTRVFEITVSRRNPYSKGYRLFVVSATGKNNHDHNSSSSGLLFPFISFKWSIIACFALICLSVITITLKKRYIACMWFALGFLWVLGFRGDGKVRQIFQMKQLIKEK